MLLLRALAVLVALALPVQAQTAWQYVPGAPEGQGLEKFARAAFNGGTYTAFFYAEGEGRYLLLYSFDRAARYAVGPVELKAVRRDAQGNLWTDAVAIPRDRLIVRPDEAYNRLFLYLDLPADALRVLASFDRVELSGVAGITTITPLTGLREAMAEMGAPLE